MADVAVVKGDTSSASGGTILTSGDMRRAAASQAWVKGGDAPGDVVPALRIHGRNCALVAKCSVGAVWAWVCGKAPQVAAIPPKSCK